LWPGDRSDAGGRRAGRPQARSHTLTGGRHSRPPKITANLPMARSSYALPPGRLQMLARVLAGLVATMAGGALIGWLVGAHVLASVVPGETVMKVNTALALGLSAGALWVAALASAGHLRLRDGLAAAVLLIAGATLAERVLRVDLGIDELLLADPGATAPGRMAIGTAGALVAFAGAVLLLDRADRRGRAVTLLALGVMLQGLFVTVTYAAGRPDALMVPGLTTIALPTGLCLAALGIGLALARPDREPAALLTSGEPGAAFVLRLVPLVVLGPLVLAPALAAGRQAGWYDEGVELVLIVMALPLLLARLVSTAANHVGALEMVRERALAQAQAIGGVGSWERELDSDNQRWSDEQFRLHGLDPAGGVPSPQEYLELVHPDDRVALRASTEANLGRRGEFVEEYRLAHPTRGVRTLLIRGDFLEADRDAGRPARLAGTCQDVTDERAALSALQAAEERFRCSFDEARIGMLIIDLDGRYERVNDAFCTIVGYTHEQLTDRSRESITHPVDVATDSARLRSLLAGEATSHTWEKRYLHASGRAIWAAINLTLIRDARGQPLHFIAQVQDITERRSYERQLEHMADHDPLTGLLNRRSFERELTSHAAQVKRYGATGAVLMLDLDNFKYFNDTQGHNAGDALIVRIAQGLQSRLRDSDVLARLGGDEFAVLLTREDEQETQTVAEALLALVGDEAMPMLVGERKRVTASIGIARFDDGERLTAEEMMVNADLAMYDAKEAGRDRWARYRTEQHDRPRIESRMKWVEQINDAITNDGFELVAQPIVSLAAHGPAQYELLLRMRDPLGGVIAPRPFLYVAERLGLIREIDCWVAERAIDMLDAQRALGRDMRFEVNISGHTIGDAGLLELVERRLRETGVAPDRLIFEVTETAAVAHIARAAAFADRLSELGCRFALDDFGAGFGSFYYLKHLPFDYLKIDGEFVRHCADNETDRILISAVVQIARGMGKRTIAEFVTNQETVEVLTRLGVDYGQGFHLGRPAPLPEHLIALDA
jgi:diguanylate cyclase (GGDEF)-like protein/PAS domain S-box-containing protein